MTATLYPTSHLAGPRLAGPRHERAGAGVPNYVLRRVVVAVVAVVVLAVTITASSMIVGALVDFGGRPAAASEIAPAGSASGAPVARIHVAEPGDTLWSIADAHRGAVGRDRYIDALIGLNGGTQIQIGQAVRLP